MKHAAGIAAGMAAGLLVGSLVAFLFNSWYAARYVRSDSDVNTLAALTLFGIGPLFLLAGAWLGHCWGRRPRAG